MKIRGVNSETSKKKREREQEGIWAESREAYSALCANTLNISANIWTIGWSYLCIEESAMHITLLSVYLEVVSVQQTGLRKYDVVRSRPPRVLPSHVPPLTCDQSNGVRREKREEKVRLRRFHMLSNAHLRPRGDLVWLNKAFQRFQCSEGDDLHWIVFNSTLSGYLWRCQTLSDGERSPLKRVYWSATQSAPGPGSHKELRGRHRCSALPVVEIILVMQCMGFVSCYMDGGRLLRFKCVLSCYWIHFRSFRNGYLRQEVRVNRSVICWR